MVGTESSVGGITWPPGNLVNVSEFDGDAKVKALDPGNGKGRQNNPFSNPAAFYIMF